MTVKRTRGRPPAGDAADRRAAILDAARAQFAAQGFGGTSMRAIAREAGVDVSLISHYFGDKSGLLVATMELPVNPIEKIALVIKDGPDGMAERLLRTFLGAWDPHRDVFSSMIRTTLGSGDSQAPMLQIARNILIAALLEVLDGDDRELRASLIASQLIGMATMRYVVRLSPLADAPIDEVVRLYAPGMQVLIDS
ncbi:TetR/AcrR family transcriptional regulator [Aeromicrobium sp.]|uniref:TetR/AcrR family transcriptional regulator n=1 Tax=Aeromicrobium sp. TaxID=1871063 RepID=UPI002FC5FD15